MNDGRLAAARALARGVTESAEEPLLATLDPGLWQVTATHAGPILDLASHLHLHAADLTGLPVARLSPTQAKTLLALLVVTKTRAPHPYPGVPATVDDVLTVLGDPAMSRPAAAHVKGALNKLHVWRLARLGPPGAEATATADLGVPVRVGPLAALWSGPWVTELKTLVERVAEHRSPE